MQEKKKSGESIQRLISTSGTDCEKKNKCGGGLSQKQQIRHVESDFSTIAEHTTCHMLMMEIPWQLFGLTSKCETIPQLQRWSALYSKGANNQPNKQFYYSLRFQSKLVIDTRLFVRHCQLNLYILCALLHVSERSERNNLSSGDKSTLTLLCVCCCCFFFRLLFRFDCTRYLLFFSAHFHGCTWYESIDWMAESTITESRYEIRSRLVKDSFTLLLFSCDHLVTDKWNMMLWDGFYALGQQINQIRARRAPLKIKWTMHLSIGLAKVKTRLCFFTIGSHHFLLPIAHCHIQPTNQLL